MKEVNIYLDFNEFFKVHKRPEVHKRPDSIKILVRFVHDIFAIIIGTREEFYLSRKWINSIYGEEELRLTHEVSNSCISFLDVTITAKVSNNRVRFTTAPFFKKLKNCVALKWSSNHPKHNYRGVIIGGVIIDVT